MAKTWRPPLKPTVTNPTALQVYWQAVDDTVEAIRKRVYVRGFFLIENGLTHCDIKPDDIYYFIPDDPVSTPEKPGDPQPESKEQLMICEAAKTCAIYCMWGHREPHTHLKECDIRGKCNHVCVPYEPEKERFVDETLKYHQRKLDIFNVDKGRHIEPGSMCFSFGHWS